MRRTSKKPDKNSWQMRVFETYRREVLVGQSRQGNDFQMLKDVGRAIRNRDDLSILKKTRLKEINEKHMQDLKRKPAPARGRRPLPPLCATTLLTVIKRVQEKNIGYSLKLFENFINLPSWLKKNHVEPEFNLKTAFNSDFSYSQILMSRWPSLSRFENCNYTSEAIAKLSYDLRKKLKINSQEGRNIYKLGAMMLDAEYTTFTQIISFGGLSDAPLPIQSLIDFFIKKIQLP